MSVLIKHMAMPKGCIYANDKDQTEYCPLLNHDDVPFCQYIETEPEIAIGIDERPVYCPLFDVSESCQDTVSRAAAVDALDEIESEIANGYGYQYPKWRKYFCELPSAQPERKIELYGDESAIDILSELRSWFSCFDEKEGLAYHALSLAIRAIKANSIAQAERNTGHWVEIGDEPYDEWECDMCGFVIDGSGCIDPEEYKDVYKFCPNCGADMRGEQDETE